MAAVIDLDVSLLTGYTHGQSVTSITDAAGVAWAFSNVLYKLDEEGIPYLEFNGTNSSGATVNTIDLSGTDKLTGLVAARMTSIPAAAGIFLEHSPTWSSNTGILMSYDTATVALLAGHSGGGHSYRTHVEASGAFNRKFIQLAQFDKSLSTNEVPVFRVDRKNSSATYQQNANTSGNFSNHKFFVGARNNAEYFFTGRIYRIYVDNTLLSLANYRLLEAITYLKIKKAVSYDIGLAAATDEYKTTGTTLADWSTFVGACAGMDLLPLIEKPTANSEMHSVWYASSSGTFNIPNGDYDVYIVAYSDSDAQRLLNCTIDGVSRFTNWRPYTDAGNTLKAVSKRVPNITVTGNSCTVQITSPNGSGWDVYSWIVFKPRFVLLDTYTDAKAACHLVRKRTAYTGNCLRLRKGTGGSAVTQEFGFDSNGILNWAAIDTWRGADSAYVERWYFQDGSGNYFVQTTESKQPLLDTVNKCITADGTDDFMESNANVDLSGTDKVDAFVRFKQLTVAGAHRMVFQHSTSANGNRFLLYYENGTGKWEYFHSIGGSFSSIRINENFADSFKVATLSVDRSLAANETTGRINASPVTGEYAANTNTSGNFANQKLYLFSQDGTQHFANVQITDFVLFPQKRGTAHQALIETDLADQQGVAVSTQPTSSFTISSTLEASDPLVPINNSTNATSYEWRVGSSTGPVRSTATAPDLSPYLAMGANTIYLTAINAYGSHQSSQSVNVSAKIVPLGNVLTYTKSGLPLGITLKYRVRAVDGSNNKSDFSNQVTLTTQ